MKFYRGEAEMKVWAHKKHMSKKPRTVIFFRKEVDRNFDRTVLGKGQGRVRHIVPKRIQAVGWQNEVDCACYPKGFHMYTEKPVQTQMIFQCITILPAFKYNTDILESDLLSCEL